VADALRAGWTTAQVFDAARSIPWFLAQIADLARGGSARQGRF
jgi:hypothetical protein